jgi:uncharacterized RDD family membrane protein YckC
MIKYDSIVEATLAPVTTPSAQVDNSQWWDHYQVSPPPEPVRRIPVPVAGAFPKPLASRLARLAAALLDAVLLLVLWAAHQYVKYGFEDHAPWKNPLAVTMLVSSLAFLTGQVLLLALRGQTIGKMVLGIRIVRFGDRSNPGLGHAWVLRYLIPALVFRIPILGQLLYLMDVLSIFGDDRRCLHDRIADTVVVEV